MCIKTNTVVWFFTFSFFSDLHHSWKFQMSRAEFTRAEYNSRRNEINPLPSRMRIDPWMSVVKNENIALKMIIVFSSKFSSSIILNAYSSAEGEAWPGLQNSSVLTFCDILREVTPRVLREVTLMENIGDSPTADFTVRGNLNVNM